MKAVCQKEKLSEIRPSFIEKLHEHSIGPLVSGAIGTLQLNITRKCNMNCRHCHMQYSRQLQDFMKKVVLNKSIELAHADSIHTIDITGGAPEMHSDLEWLLSELSKLHKKVIVRSNLVILDDPNYAGLIDVYEKNHVEIAASLPSFEKERYERQRGKMSFDSIIRILKILNRKGYGMENSGLVLNLVHNPIGAIIPASQKILEHEYRINLKTNYGIVFNNIFAVTNMPVGGFLRYLTDSDNFEDYSDELIHAFNRDAAENVMCLSTLNIASDGSVYNCDFNQMLDLPVEVNGKKNILEIQASNLDRIKIITHNHCYGCTAGSGSSCQGSISQKRIENM